MSQINNNNQCFLRHMLLVDGSPYCGPHYITEYMLYELNFQIMWTLPKCKLLTPNLNEHLSYL